MDLLFFSNQQNVYKLKASDVADAKASALGDYLPNLLQLDAGETIIYMTATADYSGQMVFFFANGKAAKVPPILQGQSWCGWRKSRRKQILC